MPQLTSSFRNDFQLTTDDVLTAIAAASVSGQAPVGTYAFLGKTFPANEPNNYAAIGITTAGSNLKYAGSVNGPRTGERADYAYFPTAVGTWRCMGRMDNNTNEGIQIQTLWLRVE